VDAGGSTPVLLTALPLLHPLPGDLNPAERPHLTTRAQGSAPRPSPSLNTDHLSVLLQSTAAIERVARFFSGYIRSNQASVHFLPMVFSGMKCFNCRDLHMRKPKHSLMNCTLRK